MKIGYDAKRLFCNNRGLGNYSRDLIRLMSQYYPENQYDLYTPKIKLDIQINPQNTRIIQPEGFYKYFPGSLWRSIGIKSDLKKSKDEIFHGLSQELPLGIEKMNIKKVVTFHDAIFIRYPELYPSTYRKIFISKNRYSCRIADKIIAISEQSKQDAIEFFNADPTKVEVVYQGCNNIFRQPSSSEEKNQVILKYQLPSDFLLFVGAIEPRKNIAAIFQALNQKKINLPLIIVGRYTDYTKELIQLANQLKISNQIFFLHQVDTKDLPSIYKLAKLFIYPSIFEGFGIPILEALCSYTPVITSSGSCFEETGGKHTIYVQPHDSDQIGDAILKVLNDSGLQEKMKSEGFLHANQFTDEKIANRLMSVYNNLLG